MAVAVWVVSESVTRQAMALKLIGGKATAERCRVGGILAAVAQWEPPGSLTVAAATVVVAAGGCLGHRLCCAAGSYLPGPGVAGTAQQMAFTPGWVRRASL